MSLLKTEYGDNGAISIIHDALSTHKGVNAEIAGDKKAYYQVVDFAYDEKTKRVYGVVSWVFK